MVTADMGGSTALSSTMPDTAAIWSSCLLSMFFYS